MKKMQHITNSPQAEGLDIEKAQMPFLRFLSFKRLEGRAATSTGPIFFRAKYTVAESCVCKRIFITSTDMKDKVKTICQVSSELSEKITKEIENFISDQWVTAWEASGPLTQMKKALKKCSAIAGWKIKVAVFPSKLMVLFPDNKTIVHSPYTLALETHLEDLPHVRLKNKTSDFLLCHFKPKMLVKWLSLFAKQAKKIEQQIGGSAEKTGTPWLLDLIGGVAKNHNIGWQLYPQRAKHTSGPKIPPFIFYEKCSKEGWASKYFIENSIKKSSSPSLEGLLSKAFPPYLETLKRCFSFPEKSELLPEKERNPK
jgi:hypothetical protein